MKKILLTAGCLLAAVLAKAQSPTFEWAKNMGGYYGYSTGTSVAVDASGNVYTTGYFAGRVDFDPGAGIFYLTSAGGNNVFITKTDASGNFLWAKQLGGTNDGSSIVVDGSNNIYVTGSFTGTADFDPGAATYNLTSSGSNDIFIFKSDASGNFAWAKQFGSTGDDYGSSIVIDGLGNVYTAGGFMVNVDFDPGAGSYFLNVSLGNASNSFISKLNSLGNFVWAKHFTGGDNSAASMALDAAGNILTTGRFSFTNDFDPGSGTFNMTHVAANSDIFISSLNSSGNFNWAKALAGSGSKFVNSIASDGTGNVYTTGQFYGTTDFDPGANTYNLTPFTYNDMFISKLDVSGNFVWAKQIGGTSSSESGNAIKLDASGNIYTTGDFSGNTDFDPGPGVYSLNSFLSNDIFVSKLNSSGNFVWAKQIGGEESDFASSIAIDASGNVYTTGFFNQTCDFDPDSSGTYNLTALGGYFSFVSKLNASGNFVWAKSAGEGAAAFAKSIAADAAGNLYSTGYFFGIVDFDPGAGTYNLSTAATDLSGDVFVTKSDASGNLIWAKQLGGISYDYANSIAVDASGNVYTAGSFKGTADFDPGAGTFNLTASSTNSDIFVSKLNASGNFVWATKLGTTTTEDVYSIALDASGNVFTAGRYFPGTNSFQIYVNKLDVSGNLVWSKIYGGPSSDIANAVKADTSGNIYITGYFGGTMDFDPGAGTFNLSSVGGNDVFVSKLDGSGNFIWAKQMGGTSNEMSSSITVNSSGDVYLTGSFSGTADFDPGAGTYNLTSTSGFDMFVSRLNNAGNFVWARGFGGVDGENVRSIASDAAGNVYTTGDFGGTVDFDPGAGIFNLTSAGGYDIFISKLDVTGNFVWAQKFGGALSTDQGYSIALDGSGNIYTNGTFYQTADFNPGAGISSLTAHGYPDLFIHKMSQCTPPSAAITPAGPTAFCSSGSVVLNAPSGANKSYQWKKGANLISGATLSFYTATTGGDYKVIVTNTVTGCSKTTTNAIVVTVYSLPAATVTPQGPTTFCAGGSVVLAANTGAGLTYKWKKNNVYISGATQSSYTATTAGIYKTVVTKSNGCSKTSGAITITVPCREGETISAAYFFDVNVFPNPNSGEFTIEFSAKPTSPVQIELIDELGKVVKRFETNGETVVFKESNLANGIYCLTARNEDKIIIKKITVTR